ncbi:predicted protein [Nematostella vectensis]|uniref:TNF receptor-associated factor 4 n=1 Tax=Nematostella vectensis TaxID=45351 RepID=A7STV3_NEMVE|nr:TNF receptor-associated factor 4 isoform X2 [Nematostella vectensis]EDO32849.1 predicted protein [Nematostella vectensis]|eukprot:XP_001624949.1 predicted protein [Nematostella vectensis]
MKEDTGSIKSGLNEQEVIQQVNNDEDKMPEIEKVERPLTKNYFKKPPFEERKHLCPVCEDIFVSPVQIKECGHRLCQHCYKTIWRSPEPKCPKCSGDLDDKIPDVDQAFENDMNELPCRCINHEWGCKVEVPFTQMITHKGECEYSDILCDNDCGAKFQRRFKQKHLDKDCPKKIISCPYCDDRHLRENKKEHLEDCLLIPLPCPNKCDKTLTIPRGQLDEHIEKECPRAKLMCEFESLGCQHRCSREKMAKHMKSEIIGHVKMIFGVVLEQKEKLDNHAQKFEEHETIMKQVDSRVGDLEKIAHSQIIWRIEDYTRKLKEAKAGNAETLFSPTFTTSKHGYRLCASVCLNGDGKGKGTHMSVFVSVLKGAFDALLKWPFHYRVTFFLLNQHENPEERKHVKFSIKPNPIPDNEPFLGRPRLEKNASFGGAKFIKHEEIESGNFIKDDTVFLKVSVDCDGLSEP